MGSRQLARGLQTRRSVRAMEEEISGREREIQIEQEKVLEICHRRNGYLHQEGLARRCKFLFSFNSIVDLLGYNDKGVLAKTRLEFIT